MREGKGRKYWVMFIPKELPLGFHQYKYGQTKREKRDTLQERRRKEKTRANFGDFCTKRQDRQTDREGLDLVDSEGLT